MKKVEKVIYQITNVNLTSNKYNSSSHFQSISDKNKISHHLLSVIKYFQNNDFHTGRIFNKLRSAICSKICEVISNICLNEIRNQFNEDIKNKYFNTKIAEDYILLSTNSIFDENRFKLVYNFLNCLNINCDDNKEKSTLIKKYLIISFLKTQSFENNCFLNVLDQTVI